MHNLDKHEACSIPIQSYKLASTYSVFTHLNNRSIQLC